MQPLVSIRLSRRMGKEAVAKGKTAIGESISSNNGLQCYQGITEQIIRNFILEAHPKLWKPILDVLTFFGAHIN